MPKIKTHKAAAKRFSFTATGKIKLKHTTLRHKLGGKTTKRKRGLRQTGYLSDSMAAQMKKQLPYGNAK